MKIFDVFTVHTGQCFFDSISNVLSLDDFRFNCSTVSIHDYVISKKDPLHSFLVEAFSSKSAILSTCEKHLLNVVMFDTYYCPHFDGVTYFTSRLSNDWFHTIKKCYKCYGLSLEELNKFYPVFYVKNRLLRLQLGQLQAPLGLTCTHLTMFIVIQYLALLFKMILVLKFLQDILEKYIRDLALHNYLKI